MQIRLLSVCSVCSHILKSLNNLPRTDFTFFCLLNFCPLYDDLSDDYATSLSAHEHGLIFGLGPEFG